MDCNKYLDTIKERNGIESDNALANYLGIHRQMISNYRKNKHGFDATTSAIIANELGMDPMAIISEMEYSRAKDDRTKNVWARVLDTLKKEQRKMALVMAIGNAIAMGAALELTPSPAQAATNQDGKTPTVCIM